MDYFVIYSESGDYALAPLPAPTGEMVVMTATMPRPPITAAPEPHPRAPGRTAVKWLTSTDHKVIGNLYLITSFAWFTVGGILALAMRAELFSPGLDLVDDPLQYNQLFTMHGTIMLLLFATPLFTGFANAIVPLQIGAPDVAFPRLNMFSYWLYLFGGLMAAAGFLTPGGAASFGWFAYAPLSDAVHSPGVGGDLWVAGLILSGFGTILASVNLITTIVCLRAPGMTMFRMPIFTWKVLITAIMVIPVFPLLAAALFALGAERRFGSVVFDAANGGPMLWQHLFWFFGHPEVYIIALPFFGIVSEVLPVFSRKPLLGFKSLIVATIAIASLSMSVWAHHMYATGQVLLPFFSIMSLLIAVPTGVKFFNWVATMWGGQITMATPMLWSLGFMATFLFGGLTGVILASPAMDFSLTDSYFVVAHFHYTVFGTVVFAMFSGFYFWWPKLTGRMLDERLGKIHYWMLFIGFHTTFLIQHCWGSTACRGVMPTICPRTASLSPTASPHAVPPCSACPPWSSTTTCGSPGGARLSSSSMTHGGMAGRSSGRPPARPHGTISPRSPGSVPSGPSFDLHQQMPTGPPPISLGDDQNR